MKYSAIVLLGGSSRRFQEKGINKVYLPINDKPLFIYSVDVFLSDNDCEEVIIVYNKNDYEKLNKNLNNLNVKLVEGGESRHQSVLNGAKSAKCDYVLVHDGARPNINIDLINRVKEGLQKSKSVSLGVLVKDTIKEFKDGIIKTIPRNNLYYMQTPQGSSRSDLINVLEKVKDSDNITDDLMAFEKYSNIRPLIVLGDDKNIKVTTIGDYEYLKYIMEKENV